MLTYCLGYHRCWKQFSPEGLSGGLLSLLNLGIERVFGIMLIQQRNDFRSFGPIPLLTLFDGLQVLVQSPSSHTDW